MQLQSALQGIEALGVAVVLVAEALNVPVTQVTAQAEPTSKGIFYTGSIEERGIELAAYMAITGAHTKDGEPAVVLETGSYVESRIVTHAHHELITCARCEINQSQLCTATQ